MQVEYVLFASPSTKLDDYIKSVLNLLLSDHLTASANFSPKKTLMN